MDVTKMYKLPADPWHIRARWTTDSKQPPPRRRRAHLLTWREELRRHSAGRKIHRLDEVSAERMHVRKDDDASQYQVVAMRLDIQMYEMDQGVYLVDFKCDGYETEDGSVLEEKEVTSPFPFLDLAARLIMQLADAD